MRIERQWNYTLSWNSKKGFTRLKKARRHRKHHQQPRKQPRAKPQSLYLILKKWHYIFF